MTSPLSPTLVDLAADRRPRPVHRQDAEALVRSAFEHRMSGLLLSAFMDGAIELPPDQAALLTARDLAVQQHHGRLWATLIDVQRRLSRLGIETAAMKGVPAEARWYRRTGERPCRDIDLLLAPNSRHRLDDIMGELDPTHALRREVARLFADGVLQSVDLTVNGIAIDLHSDILKFEVPTRGSAAVWDRCQFVTAADGSSVRTVDPEAATILFAVHLNKDRFARLIGYADLARVLRSEPLDWSFIDGFLAREGIRVHVYSSLLAVTDALQLETPPVSVPGGWRAQAWSLLWPDRLRLGGYVSLGTLQHRQLWMPWLAEGRMREAFAWWLRRRAFPPASLLRVYDPELRGPYVARWLVGRFRAWRKRRAEERLARRVAGSVRSVDRRRPADANR